MRTLAIDPGSKRIGLAMSDAGGTFANPLAVVDAGHAVEHIIAIILKESVERVVVGLPLNMDGSASASSRAAVEFAGQIEKRIGKRVVFVDERLSTFAAEQSLIERKKTGEKLTRKDKKRQLDAMAACLLLQEFLDGKLKPIETLQNGT